MKIREMSDLHLEICMYIVPSMPDDKDTVLILSGDICSFGSIKKDEIRFFKQVSKMFRAVIYVPGNHENYRYNINRVYTKFKELKKEHNLDNIHMLNRDSIVIDDIAFIGATLWTDMDKGNPFAMIDANNNMNDYHVIRQGPNFRRLKPNDTVAIHQADKNFISSELDKLRNVVRKTVVITHHAPSELSVHERWKGSNVNPAYFSNMEGFIFDNVPDYWFHGHMHDTFSYTLGVTQVMCNPRGYARTFIMQARDAALAKVEQGDLWMPSKEEFDSIWINENSNFDPYFNLVI